jgi:phosphate transport system substrate-binding protein
MAKCIRAYTHMPELVNDLRNAKRLSVNFKFQKNSTAPGQKARQDIPRLARFLKSEAANYKETLLPGFTGNTGSFDAYRAVALNRASAFKAALAAEGVAESRIAVKAYGGVSPVGCSATEIGKDRNRRVEVWIKD